MLKIFRGLIDSGFVSRTKLNTVRVKVHTSCQWTCFFCHMEGNKRSQSVKDVSGLIEILLEFRNKLHFSEVHLTGGEPSIHPRIVEIISKIVDAGFVVKMTTNGQAKTIRYKECVDAGLSELNISVHTLNPMHLGKMMYPSKDMVWGSKAIQSQIRLVKDLTGLIKIKINTCVDANEEGALAVSELAMEYGLKWRAMNVLENPEASYKALGRMCEKLRAVPVEAVIIEGSSSCSVQMHCANGFDFKVKLIRQNYLQHMCNDCPVDKSALCYEFFYGPRLEMYDGKFLVRSCIHRNGMPFVLSVNEFFKSSLYKDIRNVIS